MAAEESKAEELVEVIRAVRDRVRARHPGNADGASVPLPDLMPILHARDAAEGKVAAIGRVNPRPPGVVNSLIQSWKRTIARVLDWHVRDQIEFNRGVMQCVQAILDALDENNRAMSKLIGWTKEQHESLRSEVVISREEAAGMKDMRTHWSTWRQAWEEKINGNEIYVLRSISELQHAFQQRVTNAEASFREAMKAQHAGYRASLDETSRDIQRQLWQDLDKTRLEYERIIHDEIRSLRLRMLASGGTDASTPSSGDSSQPNKPDIQIDWLKFAERFRGSEDRIRSMQAMYVEKFSGATAVLDIGCGRGEFLEAARAAGIGARGIDLSAEAVALCRSKGLEAEIADLFVYLPAQPDRSLGGIYCSQVIEHISPERLPHMIRLIGEKVHPGGIVAFETPNPECLAIFASHFYIDPTHTRPVPSSLLAFYLEEAGFGQMEVRQLAPAEESWPELRELPEEVRRRFFGGLDYALFATKL